MRGRSGRGWIGELGQQREPHRYGEARARLAAMRDPSEEAALKATSSYGAPSAAAAAAPAGISPTSSAPATSTPRAAASRSIVATISCSADASQSSTFMLTYARPVLGSSTRTPARWCGAASGITLRMAP